MGTHHPTSPTRVHIRHATAADLPAITDILNHFIVRTPANFKTLPLDADDAASWFAGFSDSGPHHLLVAEPSRPAAKMAPIVTPILGLACSQPFHPRAAYATSVMVTAYLDPSHTGRGVGSALYSRLLANLDKEKDLHRAYAGITLPNDASIALHKKFGFTHAARFTEAGCKFNRYWDVVWMEKPLGPSP